MSSQYDTLETPVGPRVRINGKEYDYFCGTSYYCLHGDPRVIEAACNAARKYGLGPATSWNVPPLKEVEILAAQYFGTKFAHYIPTGYLGVFYMANALRNEYDIIFVDERSHYSVFDGLRAVGKQVISFAHMDAEDLQRKVKYKLKNKMSPLVVTDGIFPTTGAIAPLRDYCQVLFSYERYILLIDDSHGVGVLGDQGRGTCEYHEINSEQVYFTGTLSKAFGGFGGIIPGDEKLMEKIFKNVKATIGASPPPVPAAAASAMGIKILAEHPELREQLRANVFYLRNKLRHIGINVEISPVPIIAIYGSKSIDVKKIQTGLKNKGIMVRYIPAKGYSDAPDVDLIKITLFAQHSTDQLDKLVYEISKLI